MSQDHWLPSFNFNVEEWFEGDEYETLAICRTLAVARGAFAAAIAEKPAGRFTIRQRTRVVKRHPKGDWLAAIAGYGAIKFSTGRSPP